MSRVHKALGTTELQKALFVYSKSNTRHCHQTFAQEDNSL